MLKKQKKPNRVSKVVWKKKQEEKCVTGKVGKAVVTPDIHSGEVGNVGPNVMAPEVPSSEIKAGL